MIFDIMKGWSIQRRPISFITGKEGYLLLHTNSDSRLVTSIFKPAKRWVIKMYFSLHIKWDCLNPGM